MVEENLFAASPPLLGKHKIPNFATYLTRKAKMKLNLEYYRGRNKMKLEKKKEKGISQP